MQISPISCRRSANWAPPIRFSVVNCQPKRCADARSVHPYMRFIVFQSHPFCTPKWVKLRGNMGTIAWQYGCDCNARCKSFVINILDVTDHSNACRDTRSVRPRKQSYTNDREKRVSCGQKSHKSVQLEQLLMHKMVGGTDYATAFIQPFTIFCRPGTSIRTISFSRTKIKLSRSSSLSVRIKELF